MKTAYDYAGFAAQYATKNPVSAGGVVYYGGLTVAFGIVAVLAPLAVPAKFFFAAVTGMAAMAGVNSASNAPQHQSRPETPARKSFSETMPDPKTPRHAEAFRLDRSTSDPQQSPLNFR